MDDGVRESTQSWREVLLDAKSSRAQARRSWRPVTGRSGFWGGAWNEVFPHDYDTSGVGCTRSCKCAQLLADRDAAKAKVDLAPDLDGRETRLSQRRPWRLFEEKYSRQIPEGRHLSHEGPCALLAFYDFPAEHWIHIRTTNAIESTFATLRHRTKRVKGAFSKESALSMMLQLGLEAQDALASHHRQSSDSVNSSRACDFNDGSCSARRLATRRLMHQPRAGPSFVTSANDRNSRSCDRSTLRSLVTLMHEVVGPLTKVTDWLQVSRQSNTRFPHNSVSKGHAQFRCSRSSDLSTIAFRSS